MMNYLQKKKKAMMNYVSGITPPIPSEYQQVEWIENDTTLVSITSADYLEPVNGTVEVEWEVGVYHDQSDEPLETKTLNFQLPVENVKKIQLDVHQPVMAEGIPVSLDRVVLMPTRLETQVELFYHTDSRQSAEQLLKYRFKAIDPTSLKFANAGSNSDGPEILSTEGQSVYFHDAWTISSSLEKDALYLQFLPVYSWPDEREEGLPDAQTIKIDITEED